MKYTLFQDFDPKISRPAPSTGRPVRPYTGIWLRALNGDEMWCKVIDDIYDCVSHINNKADFRVKSLNNIKNNIVRNIY